MNKYSDKDLEFLNKLKDKIVREHRKCKGVGYIDDLQLCECMKIFKYVKELYYSKIPQDYWNLKLDELKIDERHKKITRDYMNHLDNAINQGLGIMFMGKKRGIGKTSLMAEIGKEAIIKRYNVFYTIMQNIVEDNFSDSHLILERIKESDLLLIDEVDKVMMRENSNIPKQIENFLRDVLPNKKSIIMGTNIDDEKEFEEKFKFTSLIKRYIKLVKVEGEDYSITKQKEWSDKLKDEFMNYFSKNILESAERFVKNENISNQKEYDRMF